MPRRNIALFQWETVDGIGSNKYRFKKGEVLFGKLRPYFHKVGVAPLDGVCSTDILVISPINSEWFGVVLGLVSSDNFVAYTNAYSMGTRMPRTNWKDMSRYKVALPKAEIAKNLLNLYDRLLNRLLDIFINPTHSPKSGTHCYRSCYLVKFVWTTLLRYWREVKDGETS